MVIRTFIKTKMSASGTAVRQENDVVSDNGANNPGGKTGQVTNPPRHRQPAFPKPYPLKPYSTPYTRQPRAPDGMTSEIVKRIMDAM